MGESTDQGSVFTRVQARQGWGLKVSLSTEFTQKAGIRVWERRSGVTQGPVTYLTQGFPQGERSFVVQLVTCFFQMDVFEMDALRSASQSCVRTPATDAHCSLPPGPDPERLSALQFPGWLLFEGATVGGLWVALGWRPVTLKTKPLGDGTGLEWSESSFTLT